jgi:hypothetical protein
LRSAVNGQGRFILGEDEVIRGDNRQGNMDGDRSTDVADQNHHGGQGTRRSHEAEQGFQD